ncbi:MAG: outer membrane lipoprotein carrier protein LolA [Flavobacteriaceae bacterium]|nr:outer membrane lipoprotein carrier protein LolA [Flavobacteriaceae bacterium]
MYRVFFFFVLSFNVFPIIAQEQLMNGAEIATFKKQVANASSTTTTIKSDFIQYKHLDFLDNAITTYGQLWYKSPNLVKWEYTKPYQYSVIFKGNQMLVNDGGNKSSIDMERSKLFKKLSNLIVNSVQGTLFDENDFETSFFITEKGNKVIFVSKDEKLKKYITSFELVFNKKDATVIQIKMIEPSGDYTQIVFTHKEINTSLPSALFSF